MWYVCAGILEFNALCYYGTVLGHHAFPFIKIEKYRVGRHGYAGIAWHACEYPATCPYRTWETAEKVSSMIT